MTTSTQDLTLSEARRLLSGTEKLRFGNSDQVAAVQRIERSGAKSDGQKKRWVEARARFIHELAGALESSVIPCPHCGRVPWMAQKACGKPLVRAYGLWSKSTRGASVRWFLEYCKAWYRVSGKRVLRMVDDESI